MMRASLRNAFGALQKASFASLNKMTSRSHAPESSQLSKSGQTANDATNHQNTVQSPVGLPELQYEHLSTTTSIRLLTLDPGAGNEPIVCHLHHNDIEAEATVEYEALSYVWGDSTQRTTIVVNGSSFQATQNLTSALQHLRHQLSEGPRILWVDAICINQADLEERTQQVQIMQRIYRKAKRVLAWTGEAGEEGEMIAKLCERLQPLVGSVDSGKVIDDTRRFITTDGFARSKKNIETVNKALADGWDGKNVEDSVKYIPPADVAQKRAERYLETAQDLTSEAWQYLVRLLHRQWFRRIWMVQEASLPKTLMIYMGKHSFSWETLTFAVYSCPRIVTGATSRTTYKPLMDLDNARDGVHQGDTVDLLILLMVFRSFEATDPHDKIFALLGVVRPPVNMVPDYRQSLQVCYQEATLSMLNHYGNLNPLCLSLRIGERMPGLPSWVPDWSDRGPHPRCMIAWQGIERTNPDIHHHTFAAARNSVMSAIVVDEKKLRLRGHAFDQIVEIADKLTGDAMKAVEQPYVTLQENEVTDEDSWVGPGLAIVSAVRKSIAEILVWYDLADLAKRGDEDYPSIPGQSNKEAFMRTATLDHPFIGMEKARVAINDWCDVMQSEEMQTFMLDKVAPGQSKAVHFSHMMQILANVMLRLRPFNIAVEASYYRSFAITKRGMFAVVPQDCRVGDNFMLFQGAIVPIVMRKHPDMANSWEMLGDAYVHGVMDGEAYDESLCADVIVV